MPQISVAPTRTNLIRLKKELRFAQEGYEILDRKREALTGELVRVAKEGNDLLFLACIERARVNFASGFFDFLDQRLKLRAVATPGKHREAL